MPSLLLLLAVLVHVGALLAQGTEWTGVLFNDAAHRFGPGCDFFSIYAAGVKARLGESVYTIGGHVEQVPYAYAFRYAPVVAYTLGLALSWLPHLTAYGVWLCLCELALLRNIRLTVSLCTPGPACRSTAIEAEGGSGSEVPGVGSQRAGALRQLCAHPYSLAALWLLFSPYYLELYVGQFTFVTASLVFWAYLAWSSDGPGAKVAPGSPAPTAAARLEGESGRKSGSPFLKRFTGPVLGDGCWAAAVLLKMMPLLFLPVALIRGRWKAAAVTLGVLACSSWLYFRRFPGDWRVFTATNADPRPTWHAGNQGLMALLYAFSGENVGRYLVARNVAIALVGVLLAWLTYRAWKAAKGRSACLHLYAAASAGYLLCYKDVWEHHYVLLLPPLILLARRKESPWLWLPPFLVSALPTLFALYDIPGIGYNEDPQRYWLPAVSLLHHAWKPVAPLWLCAGIAISALRQSILLHRPRPATFRGRISPRLCVAAVSLALVLALTGVGTFARAAISEQRAVTREVVWTDEVFRKQELRENCGPAALAAVSRHFGIPATEAEVARLAGTTESGTSMLGLQRAAEAKGLVAAARRVAPAELGSLPRPCILFFHEGHFVVLTGIQGKRLYLADPSSGQRVWSANYLRQFWHGEVLLVGPSELRGQPPEPMPQ